MRRGENEYIIKYVFDENAVKDETMFRTKWPRPRKKPANPNAFLVSVFVTEQFVDRVEKNKLTGFDFFDVNDIDPEMIA